MPVTQLALIPPPLRLAPPDRHYRTGTQDGSDLPAVKCEETQPEAWTTDWRLVTCGGCKARKNTAPQR